MRRRLIAALTIVALVMQALAVTSTGLAEEAASDATMSEHCPGAGHGSSCPCCPEGKTMPAGCLSLCAGFAVQTQLSLPVVQQVSMRTVVPFIAPAAITHVSVPPNPPPILR